MYIEIWKEEKSCSDAESVLEDFISKRVSSRSGGMTRNKRKKVVESVHVANIYNICM